MRRQYYTSESKIERGSLVKIGDDQNYMVGYLTSKSIEQGSVRIFLDKDAPYLCVLRIPFDDVAVDIGMPIKKVSHTFRLKFWKPSQCYLSCN